MPAIEDTKSQEIDGVKFTKTHTGQKRKAEGTTMDNHFRSYFDIKDYGDGRYFYRVTFPSTH